MNVAGGWPVRPPARLALIAAAGLLLAVAAPAVATQVVGPGLDGLEWTFVRIRYSSEAERLEQFRRRYWSEPWAIDGPAAEQNLSRRMARVTSVKVNDPLIMELSDRRLWVYPWIYFVEPANMELSEEEAGILREFLLRGGTATFDDFHGPLEWELFEQQLRRVFPDRALVELASDHPVFSCFYVLPEYPQIAGLGSFFGGVTWEKGGYRAQLHGVLDDNGRAMVLANFNTDMGDGWEWSNAEEYPGYVEHTGRAYRMIINEIVYALTH